MTVITIIELMVAVIVGFIFGFTYGLSRHAAIIDWLQARSIRRWQSAMQSLGYEQWRIDQVLERMGKRIILPQIPAPTNVLTEPLKKHHRKNRDAIYCPNPLNQKRWKLRYKARCIGCDMGEECEFREDVMRQISAQDKS